MNHIKHILCAALLLCAIATKGEAQQKSTVRGTVLLRENGRDGKTSPLAGAQVRWLNTKIGVVAKNDGSFSITRPDSAALLAVSSIGAKPDTICVAASDTVLTITLRENAVETKQVTVEADGGTISNATVKEEKISQKKLEQSACCSLAESFEKSPSVEVTFADAATGAKTIQLLGLRGVYTQMLTEAVPSIRGLATPFGLDYVPGPFIEGISISKGAASVANGYEGITGQINIEYKKAQRDIPFFANAYVNNMGRTELNLTSAQKVSEQWQTMVMLHGRTFRHEQDGNGDGFIDMPTFSQLNGMARVYHEGTVEFQFVGKALFDEYGGGTLTHSHQAGNGHDYRIGTRTNRYEFFSKAALKGIFSEEDRDLALIVSGASHSMNSSFGNRRYNGDQTTLTAKLVGISELGDNTKLMFGASMMIDRYDEQFAFVQPADTTAFFARTERVPGAFAELTYSGISNLTVVAGLRADAHNMFGSFITPRIHAKYDLSDYTSLRVSAGSGMRIANLVADNLSAFVNARTIQFAGSPQPERAWNYGASFTTTLTLFNTVFTFDAEYFHTRFSNQIAPDFDRSVRDVFIGPVAGASYANSGLVQVQFAPVTNLDLNIAYRLIDAHAFTGGALRERPLISPHRLLATLSYLAPADFFLGNGWQFDATGVWNSGGRIPTTEGNPDAFRMDSRFDGFFRLNGQIQKRWERFDMYLGIENATNFLQQRAVIAADNPHSSMFDSSLIWGPLDNRMVYLGIRWRVE
ncbi:MAG: TonB-dependent receptor [Candidatus Kapabacteria bacterium]|nr:TonB-dependent receptor [Candidatus Kapabacteria bacterium]